MIKTNSLSAWILAARPKTLTAAAVPVLIGIAYAFRDRCIHDQCLQGHDLQNFQWLPALLCLLFAWIMQIDSNFVNDYFDYKHGNDDETRLGPKRACAEGWITLPAMKRGIIITTLLGCLTGLPLILYGGWEMVFVGMACVVFCFLYTTKFSYLGLGDLLVLVFFGIVPVCCTYYVVMPATEQTFTWEVFLASVACGMTVDTLLVVNNYRDRDNDCRAGKKTLIVRIGSVNAERFYLALGILPSVIMMALILWHSLTMGTHSAAIVFYSICIVQYIFSYREMKRIHEGVALNGILGYTSRNIFIFGTITFVAVIWSVLAIMI